MSVECKIEVYSEYSEYRTDLDLFPICLQGRLNVDCLTPPGAPSYEAVHDMMLEWCVENIDNANFTHDYRTFLMFGFKNSEDAMLFKLSFTGPIVT